MKIEQVHTAFREVVNRPGIYHLLGIPKNNVAQYRWKLKRGIHITLDKKLCILQKAGYRVDQFEYTRNDLIELAKFILRSSKITRDMGPEYLVEKWKIKNE